MVFHEEKERRMKILITGAKGFLGRNLSATLGQRKDARLYLYDLDTDPKLLDRYAADCDFVFHLAGVNRPVNEGEYEKNASFTKELLDALGRHENKAPVLFSSSIQAALDNAYGQSKKAAEDLIFAWGPQQGVPVYVYRLTNLFGKWSRPAYNSVVATFCHSVARGLPITVRDPDAPLTLAYVDDVVAEFLRAMEGGAHTAGSYCLAEPVHTTTVGKVAELIASFHTSRESLSIPDMGDPFVKALYATYLSYLPEDEFGVPLKKNADHRGSFTELVHTADRGQVSVNILNPGIVKGNHWHHTKNEKFTVVLGQGIIRLRRIEDTQVLEYLVSADQPEAVDIPPGYVHNMENLGDTEMVVIIWASENFDPAFPDTYAMEV